MKPKREVVDGAVSLAAEAGWSLGRHFDDNDAGAMAVVGVHVRRGDKVVEAAPPSWKDYAKGAEACALQIAAAAEGNGAPLMPSVRVYVSSDSAASGGEAMWQAEQGWQVQYTTLGGQPHNISLRVAVANEKGLTDGVAESGMLRTHQVASVSQYARQAMRAALVLSESDCLVTTFSSNMG